MTDKIAELDKLSDDDYLWSFESATLAPYLWTHYAHMRIAWLYLDQHPCLLAVQKIRSGILRYNSIALGRPEAYHETITLFFAHMIHLSRQQEQTWPEFVAQQPQLCARSSEILREYYSKDHLFTDEARASFVYPDLQDLLQPDRLQELLTSLGI